MRAKPKFAVYPIIIPSSKPIQSLFTDHKRVVGVGIEPAVLRNNTVSGGECHADTVNAASATDLYLVLVGWFHGSNQIMNDANSDNAETANYYTSREISEILQAASIIFNITTYLPSRRTSKELKILLGCSIGVYHVALFVHSIKLQGVTVSCG